MLSAVDSDPLIGSVVAKHYLVDALLGEGGMGRVYRAHHTLLQHRQLALKIMIGDLAATLAMRLRFGQEADSASRLAHPNLVSVFDYGKTEEGLLFLAMDLIEGKTLAQVIAEEAPLGPRRAIGLARQVCHGLAHAHDRGLVHRDFKPENVMITQDPQGERAVITDFGIAISRDADEEAPARLTSAGIALGTPIYAAPEQTHGRPVDQRADLFALGVTLYEMLSGRVPFDGSGIEVIHKNAFTSPPAIELRSGVRLGPALELLVRKLMERAPEDRFASAVEVIEALDEAERVLLAPSGERPIAVVTPAATAPMPSVPRRRFVALALGVGALAIIGTAMAVRTQTTQIPTGTGTAQPPPQVVATVPQPNARTTPPPAISIKVLPPASAMPPPATALPAPPPATALPAPPPDRPSTARAPAPERRDTITSAKPRPLKVAIVVETADGGTSVVVPPVVVPAEPSGPVDHPTQAPAPAPIPAPAATSTSASASASASTPTLTPALTPTPAAVPAVAQPLVTRARASLSGLGVRGSLSSAVVRRALERVDVNLRRCFATEAVTARRSSATTVHVTFVVDDTRQATNVRASAATWPALAACVGGAIGELRTQNAPDVGTVSVSVDIAFVPEEPS